MNDDEKKIIEEEDEFEKNIANLKEWQDNQYNPGYYIGTGRVPRPISSLAKYPLILIILGLLGLLASVLTFIPSKISFASIFTLVLGVLFSSIFLYGGITRLKNKKNNKED